MFFGGCFFAYHGFSPLVHASSSSPAVLPMIPYRGRGRPRVSVLLPLLVPRGV